MAEKDILTTADAARMLGVSVRTAQLLIEGGAVASWKTPGGHRRVHRADVEALVEGRGPDRSAASAVVVVVAGDAQRCAAYRQLFDGVGECDAKIFNDADAALMAVGAVGPRLVIVDQDSPGATKLVESLAANSILGPSRVIVVGEAGAAGDQRFTRVGDPLQAVSAARHLLADHAAAAIPAAGLPFPIALNEGQRLVALERSGLLDTPPEEAFDRITWLAANTLDAPISLLGLMSRTRQWFKAARGLDLIEIPRSTAFCNHTLLQKGVFMVEDMSRDPRFAANPSVAAKDGLRFYAGAPVLDAEGYAVGSLCVLDHKVRRLDEQQISTLSALAALASAEVRLRGAERLLREARRRSAPAADAASDRSSRR